MSRHFTPLEVCERALGHISEISKVLGLHEKTPYQWRHASASRDAGDVSSFPTARKLLAYFKAHNIPVTAEHLVFGASFEELERIGLITKEQPPAPDEVAA